MITALFLDCMVVIPQGKNVGGGMKRTELREQNFRSEEGWDIRETLPGVFSLNREGMDSPCTIGGYGYNYVQHIPKVEEAPAEEPKKAKKRGA